MMAAFRNNTGPSVRIAPHRGKRQSQASRPLDVAIGVGLDAVVLAAGDRRRGG